VTRANIDPGAWPPLARLFSPGTTLAEVPPDFRGMPWRLWHLAKISEQAEQWRRTIPPDFEPPLNRKSIWSPQDSYGMKGF